MSTQNNTAMKNRISSASLTFQILLIQVDNLLVSALCQRKGGKRWKNGGKDGGKKDPRHTTYNAKPIVKVLQKEILLLL